MDGKLLSSDVLSLDLTVTDGLGGSLAWMRQGRK
jgi:hypothetical protein